MPVRVGLDMVVKPLIHTHPTPKRPSLASDNRSHTIYRLAAIINKLLLFIIAGFALDLFYYIRKDNPLWLSAVKYTEDFAFCLPGLSLSWQWRKRQKQ